MIIINGKENKRSNDELDVDFLKLKFLKGNNNLRKIWNDYELMKLGFIQLAVGDKIAPSMEDVLNFCGWKNRDILIALSELAELNKSFYFKGYLQEQVSRTSFSFNSLEIEIKNGIVDVKLLEI
jgi:hypothetical protein